MAQTVKMNKLFSPAGLLHRSFTTVTHEKIPVGVMIWTGDVALINVYSFTDLPDPVFLELKSADIATPQQLLASDLHVPRLLNSTRAACF